MIQQKYPGVYPDENKIIPYSPRRKFGFTSPMSEMVTDKVIKLESMANMPIDQIVNLYKEGYVIEGLPEAPQTSYRQIRFGFMDNPDRQERYERQRRYGFAESDTLPFEHTPPETFERERKYGFESNISIPPTIPPGVIEQWQRQRRYGFTGQGSQGGTESMSPTIMAAQDGIYVSTGAILLGVGLIALFYYLKSKGKT